MIQDDILASLFTKEGPGSATLGSCGQAVFHATGRWTDGQKFSEAIMADSRQDAINKVFERFDPLMEQLVLQEVR